MSLKIRFASAWVMALALMAPLSAGADEPAPMLTAQTVPADSSGTAAPAGGTGPEGVSPLPSNNTTGDQTLAQVPTPISPPPRIGLFPEFGAMLLNDGIEIHGIAFDHFLANPSAGVAPGHTTNLAAFRPVIDFDLQRLIGLPGGVVHVGLTFFGLRSDVPQIITQAGGVLTGFQTTPATQTDLVSLLTYEQRFLNGKFSIEAGRTNVYNYFLLPNSLDPFAYFSTTFEVVGDFPSNPYPVWGGRATYKLTPTWYLQAGAFEDDYDYAVDTGDRFGDGLASGAQILGEIGQRSEFSNAAYPSNLEAGFEWNTRSGRSNLKGSAAPANTLLQPTNYPGGGVIYFQGEQVLWRGAQRAAGPPADIALYGSLDVSVGKPQPIDMDAMVGTNFTGFIPGRPFDALGLQARYQRLSQDEVNAENFRQELLARLPPGQQRDGFAFEAVGNVQLTPAIAFRPIVEYFINPDNYYPPAPPGRPHDGFEAGFFTVVSLGRLLGTSLKPF